MARIRSINPDACDSDKLAAASPEAERLFWRLLTHCDDDGRCEDNPRLIWGRCGPTVATWTAETVDSLLTELHEAGDDEGLITRYEVGGKGFVQVNQWSTYQHPQKPKPSVFPPLDIGSPIDRVPVNLPVEDGSHTATGPVSSGEEGRGEEKEGSGIAVREPYGDETATRRTSSPPALIESGTHLAELVIDRIVQHNPTRPKPRLDHKAKAAGQQLLDMLGTASDRRAALIEVPAVLDWALTQNAHWSSRIRGPADLASNWLKIHADYSGSKRKSSKPVGSMAEKAIAAARGAA